MTKTDIAPFTVTVDPETMKTWAWLLRDPNPIHLDLNIARAQGLPGVVVQGPANLAFILNALKAAYPGGEVMSLEVRYLDNAFGGETVEAAGRVTGIEMGSGTTRTTCDIWLKSNGRDVIGGTAVIVEPTRPGHNERSTNGV